MCNNVVEVFQGDDHGEVDPPDCLYTDNLATCIGIGVLDLGARRGYLVHTSGLAASGTADEFFSALGACSSNVQITVAGGDACDDDGPERPAVGEDRAEALRKLQAIFPHVTPVEHWSPPNRSCWIEVDPGEGVTHCGFDP